MVKAKGWANWSLAGLEHKSCVARLTGSLAHALPALMSNRCHTLLQCFRRVLPFTTGRQQNLGSCGAFLIQWQVIILGLVSMLLSPYCSDLLCILFIIWCNCYHTTFDFFKDLLCLTTHYHVSHLCCCAVNDTRIQHLTHFGYITAP